MNDRPNIIGMEIDGPLDAVCVSNLRFDLSQRGIPPGEVPDSSLNPTGKSVLPQLSAFVRDQQEMQHRAAEAIILSATGKF